MKDCMKDWWWGFTVGGFLGIMVGMLIVILTVTMGNGHG